MAGDETDGAIEWAREHFPAEEGAGPGGFVEQIPFGVWMCDVDGNLRYASRSFLELIDMSMEEAQGFGWMERVVSKDRDIVDRWKWSVEHREDWSDEYRVEAPDGTIHSLLVRGHYVPEGSGVRGCWIGVHMDITGRKQEQERLRMLDMAQAKQRERERLSRRLHDHLQQLMMAAHMRIDVLRQGEADPKKQAGLDRVLSIAGDAIEASRNLASELNPPVLYESGLLAGLRWLAEWMEEMHGLQVALEADDEADLRDHGNTVLLFEIVRELLLNIVKHAKVKQARLAVERHDDTQMRVTVSDAGSGFDPETMGNEQTGLGLASIGRRVESAGGSCEIASTPGEGTTVALTVPLNGETE